MTHNGLRLFQMKFQTLFSKPIRFQFVSFKVSKNVYQEILQIGCGRTVLASTAQCVYTQSHAYMTKIHMTYHEAPTTKFRLFLDAYTVNP